MEVKCNEKANITKNIFSKGDDNMNKIFFIHKGAAKLVNSDELITEYEFKIMLDKGNKKVQIGKLNGYYINSWWLETIEDWEGVLGELDDWGDYTYLIYKLAVSDENCKQILESTLFLIENVEIFKEYNGIDLGEDFLYKFRQEISKFTSKFQVIWTAVSKHKDYFIFNENQKEQTKETNKKEQIMKELCNRIGFKPFKTIFRENQWSNVTVTFMYWKGNRHNNCCSIK